MRRGMFRHGLAATLQAGANGRNPNWLPGRFSVQALGFAASAAWLTIASIVSAVACAEATNFSKVLRACSKLGYRRVKVIRGFG
jgi:hypothetical protein